MDHQSNTAIPQFLSGLKVAQTLEQIAQNWFDQTVTYRLEGGIKLLGTGPGQVLGGHLRRSFLGALGRGASPESLNDKPCPWTPPCALDVFMREQYREARGNGLPKPYVIFTDAIGDDLLVSLRVFGAANDWFAATSEAMVAGMRNILPWKRLFGCDMPMISGREIKVVKKVAVPVFRDQVSVEFLTPVDASGKGGAIERSLLARLLRRVGGLARWQGMMFSDDYARNLALQIGALNYQQSRLVTGGYLSPNRKSEHRHHKTMTGVLVASGLIDPVLPMLAIGERCHLGRAAVEGLGRYRILRD